MKPSFFIFGIERSGTTLLSALLSTSPDTFVLNDSDIYKIFADTYYNYNSNFFKQNYKKLRSILFNKVIKFPNAYLSIKKIQSFMGANQVVSAETDSIPRSSYEIDSTFIHNYLKNLKKRYSVPRKDGTLRFKNYLKSIKKLEISLKKNKDIDNAQNLLNVVFESLLPQNELKKNIIKGEKSPLHLFYYDWIKNIYPYSKFIKIIRNPIGNISSISKRRMSIEKAILDYRNHFNKLNSIKSKNSKNIILIRYEDLIRDPNTTLEQIFSFLDIKDTTYNINFNYYDRKQLIGTKIDPNRDKTSMYYLDKKERKFIKNEFSGIFNTYYKDFYDLYSLDVLK